MPSRERRAAGTGATPELLTDHEGAELLGVGPTRFLELQKETDFPACIWLGKRGKRHVRTELMNWALSRRQKAAA